MFCFILFCSESKCPPGGKQQWIMVQQELFLVCFAAASVTKVYGTSSYLGDYYVVVWHLSNFTSEEDAWQGINEEIFIFSSIKETALPEIEIWKGYFENNALSYGKKRFEKGSASFNWEPRTIISIRKHLETIIFESQPLLTSSNFPIGKMNYRYSEMANSMKGLHLS